MTCLIALAVGRALGYSERVLADTYYTALVRFVGCTSDAHEFLEFAAGDDVGLQQARAVVANGTPDEVAPRLTRFLTTAGVTGDVAVRVRDALGSRQGMAALATRLDLGATIFDALGHAFERWDGEGFPDGQSGEDVSPAVRESSRPACR